MGKVKEAVFNWPPNNAHDSNLFNSNPMTFLTPHGYVQVRPSQENCSTPLIPLGGGGFIFNYPPLYSSTPLPPFSTSMEKSNSKVGDCCTPEINQATLSPPSSPVGISGPLFQNEPAQNQGLSRKEKLEKYRQKRTKRNWNRPVDQARRERAQARERDELGHFIPTNKSLNTPNMTGSSKKERFSETSRDISQELEILIQDLSSCSDIVEGEASCSNNGQSTVYHENRIHWSSVPMNDVFNTLNPNTSYADAFKEKIDFGSIELHWTASPYVEYSKANYPDTNINLSSIS